MKNKFEVCIISIILFLNLISCNETNDKDRKSSYKYNIQSLKVYENIDKKNHSYSLDEIANDRHLVTFETTDNSLISDIKVEFLTSQYICMSDRHMLIFFSHSGKYQFKLNAKGDGPGEYNSISDVFYDSNNSILFIHDMHGKKILKYDNNGQFINDLDINDIGAITNLDKDHYAVSFSPFANKNMIMGIYNKSFEVENEFILSDFNNEKHTDKGFIMINNFIQSNRELCIKPLFSDTVYQIYPNKVEPFFVVDKQNLNPPIEVLSDLSQKKNRKKYISNEYGIIINDLYFMTFYYNNKLYQDIWNIKKGELLYRNIVSSAKDKYGVPVNIDNMLIHAWPVFVNDELVYCKINESDQQLLKTNAEDNDLMLKFMLLPVN